MLVCLERKIIKDYDTFPPLILRFFRKLKKKSERESLNNPFSICDQ